MNRIYYFAQDSEQYMRGMAEERYDGDGVMGRIHAALDALEMRKGERLVYTSEDPREFDEMEEKCYKEGVLL